ncbi:MAG: hypothetical protein A2W01_05575 [Candidatus Solincola sediminis]|uniref:GP-PDE domain-containing protein n=1 Tax=Candidatus Solincola sediminis TaxID=1797199 RepID=A0A1F2WGB8_9ACTN|nr:MAG: hypothetical protein A2Y75_04115 [Candidatus Solincola sediminis]OFW56210.1 MAG: hypothetical protein A2W01_05575 [Candidatus Solincola sediminis]
MYITVGSDGRAKRKEFWLICHRGGRGFGPENTLEALGKALEYGVEMIETDVRMSNDGVPFIHHSPFLGIHLLQHLDMSEIRERAPEIPTLEEFFDLAGGRCAFNIEIKRCEARILAEVVSWAHISLPLLVSSFNTRFLSEFKATGGPARIGLLTQYEMDTNHAVQEALECGADVLLPVNFYTKPGLVDAAHEAGLRVVPWTVNSSGSLQSMVAMGVDGLITDSYRELAAILKSGAVENNTGEKLLDAG